ncbi:MAG: glycosyl hydrolase [Planctomycetes bacterium]|nr:glycosyl hydrolase [Planctomycetota bacterium]
MSNTRAAAICCFTLLALQASLVAQVLAKPQLKPNTLTKAEKKQGFKLLFDGKSAAGWNSWRTKKALKFGKWSVEDQALTLGRGGGDIYTTEKYENFELMLEWKTTGNGGILIRVDPSVKGPIYKVAPEMQIERTGGKGSTSAGGLYALYDIECEGEKIIHPNGWNKVTIRIVDGHGIHWFNGKKVADYKIGSDDWNARVAKSKFKNWKGFGETANGHIGLQDHGAKISFRNVKIRRLSSKR